MIKHRANTNTQSERCPSTYTADIPCDILHKLTVAAEGLLQGQVAIITGSGQGIGAAAAKLFAKEVCRLPAHFCPLGRLILCQGAKVVVTDLDEGTGAWLSWLCGRAEACSSQGGGRRC